MVLVTCYCSGPRHLYRRGHSNKLALEYSYGWVISRSWTREWREIKELASAITKNLHATAWVALECGSSNEKRLGRSLLSFHRSQPVTPSLSYNCGRGGVFSFVPSAFVSEAMNPTCFNTACCWSNPRLHLSTSAVSWSLTSD